MDENPDLYNIRLGTVRQRSELRPKFQICCRPAQDWFANIDTVPKKVKQSKGRERRPSHARHTGRTWGIFEAQWLQWWVVFVPKVNLKNNPARRWVQPDRRFFACGACHLLAYAHLEEFSGIGYRPFWIRPHEGYTGNHIFVADGIMAFDYHGYSCVASLLQHYSKRGARYYPGWNAEVVLIEVSELLGGGTRAGLHLRPPDGFLGDALQRARVFVSRHRESLSTVTKPTGDRPHHV